MFYLYNGFYGLAEVVSEPFLFENVINKVMSSAGADLGYVQSVARLTYFLQRNINLLLFQNLNNLFSLRL